MNAKSYFSPRLLPLCICALLSSLLLSSCSKPPDESADSEESKVRVVTTATMIKDMVESIGGDRVAVENLMGPGVDPHLYRPSVIDISKINRTEAVFYLGLFFEELMQEVLLQRKSAGHKIFALGDTLPEERLLRAYDGTGIFDPHVWFDVELWIECIAAVVAGLIELDPAGEVYYQERAEQYRDRLQKLHEWAMQKVSELPEEQRILVTSHDAYSYFGRAFGFQVVGLMGISTSSEAGLADITRLVDFIQENNLKAIFVESSVSPRAIERVSRDSGAAIGGELFSDSLGAEGEERLGFDVGTYEGMIRYNITTIVDALRG